MQALKYSEILEAVRGRLVCTGPEEAVTGVTTDSRRVAAGDLFIPLKGETFDGHDYIAASLTSGASGAITHRDVSPVPGKTVIRVEDTLRALADIARYYRTKFPVPLVGITGSVGKTCTKDMVTCVLAMKYRVLKTKGNLNNEIGLPLTLLGLDESHEAAVVEMGMSGFGEISRLTSVARPDIAIITNIGMSHIEKLGSRQNILKAKMEIFEGLSKNGLAILNGDDALLAGLKGLLDVRTVFYGLGEEADYQAYNIKTAGERGSHFQIVLGSCEYTVHVPAPGIHNVHNALAAIAAGLEMGVSPEEVLRGIEAFSPGKMRLNIITAGTVKILNDTYNASPQSMEAALNVLSDIRGKGSTIAVLGDMLEMGEWAAKAHYDVGKYAAATGLNYLVTVGEAAHNIALGALEGGMEPGRIERLDSNSGAVTYLKGLLKEGDTVLVKGSRGMKMEEIVEQLASEGL